MLGTRWSEGKRAWALISALLLCGCAATPPGEAGGRPGTSLSLASGEDAFWRNANVYFLLTDRFHNGDPSNDDALPAKDEAGLLRGFEGGDIRGVTQRIEEGYFNALGVDAIWTTPLISNVRGSVIEGEWGRTYAYHGYWPSDWSKVDPRLGTEEDLAKMVSAAHRRGLRVIVDVIINHTGPVTDAGDPRWPDDWVRPTGGTCTHKSFATSVPCELSFTLQDIRTESDKPVELPAFLVERWRAEGRLERETAELDAFFARTGYPRAPRYYIIKWLTDWVREYGVDGFRVDTAKHIEPEIWGVLKHEAELALADWRARNPDRIAGDKPFYMVGEVYNFGLVNFGQGRGRSYDYGDRQVDFFEHGFDALINMGFATHARQPIAQQYATYAHELTQGAFAGRGMLNYIASHDDMNPIDPERRDARANATRLMLSPGGVQIYYGDEIARSLVVPGTRGDSTLRSRFDWAAVQRNAALLEHWQRLGRFRQAHPAVGAGRHSELSASPYVFARTLEGEKADRVVIAVGLPGGRVQLPTGGTFADGTRVRDAYRGADGIVSNGQVTLEDSADVVLLEPVR
jgi:alpha-amylase